LIRQLCQLALPVLLIALSGCTSFLRDAKLDYRTVQADPNHDTEAAKGFNEKALKLIAKGNQDKAEQMFQKALIADVSYGPAHNNLGHMYFCQEKYYLAAWEFEYAIKLMPEHPEPYNNLGLVYEAVGKFNEAVEAYESAHKLQPSNPEVIGNLARACIRRGDPVAKVRPLLNDLVFYDTRPVWVAWAKEQLAFSSVQTQQPSIEVIPAPPGSPGNIEPQEQELRLPTPDTPVIRGPQVTPIGSPAPVPPSPRTTRPDDTNLR
jgi:tetratricopeptide (TPR) repeat protein